MKIGEISGFLDVDRFLDAGTWGTVVRVLVACNALLACLLMSPEMHVHLFDCFLRP